VALELDAVEKALIDYLMKNARAAHTVVARELKTTPAVVSYRLKQLEQRGVIGGYRVQLNSEAIGMQRFRVQLEFRGSYSRCKAALKTFCEKTPCVTRLEFQVGSWPAELGIEVDSFSTLHTVLDSIRSIEKGAIHVQGVTMFRATASLTGSLWTTDVVLKQSSRD
jgi:Lrp/AsnC family leucine-responsive transcriptional regulator